jgi:hypothetical protein
MARSRNTPSVRNGAENGQSYTDRHKKRPPDWAAFRFDQLAEVSLRLQKNLVSRFIGRGGLMRALRKHFAKLWLSYASVLSGRL